MTPIPTIRQALQLADRDAVRLDSPFEADGKEASGAGELLGKDGTTRHTFRFRMEWNECSRVEYLEEINSWNVDIKQIYAPMISWFTLDDYDWLDFRITSRSLVEEDVLKKDAPLTDDANVKLLKEGITAILDEVFDRQLVLNVMPIGRAPENPLIKWQLEEAMKGD